MDKQTDRHIPATHRDSAPVNALLARALLNKSLLAGRPTLVEQAAVYANRAVTLDPDEPDTLVTLGLVQNAMGHHEQALVTFDRVTKLRGPRADVLVGRADALNILGRGAEAETDYLAAIELKPDDVNVHMKYGLFSLGRGDAPRAARHLEHAVQLSPDSAHVHLNLGTAYYMMGRHDDAMKAFRRSNEVAPNAAALTNIGTIHFYAGRYADACTAFEQAVALSPSDYMMWGNLGDAYRWTPARRGDAPEAYARAIEHAREAVRINGREVMPRLIIASAHAKRGEMQPARREVQQALEINPTDAIALYTAAVIALMEKRPDSAVSWLERAIAAGYPRGDLMKDPELSSIRDDPAFRAIVAR